MRLPEQTVLDLMPNAVRKPEAAFAVTAALAAGAALESPAQADAHPAGPNVPAASPKEQDSHDCELLPSLGVAGFMVASCAAGMYKINRTMRDL